MEYGMEQLRDRTIKNIAISPDGLYMAFNTDQGVLRYYADGDCCSNSWFESITGVNNMDMVTSVQDIDMPDVPDPNEYECIQTYGIKITTNRGHIIIEYRNSSNGYYGGACVLVHEIPKDTTMHDIRHDWQINV